MDERGHLQVSYKLVNPHHPEYSFMFKRSVKKGPKHMPNSLLFQEEWKFYDCVFTMTQIQGPSYSFVHKNYTEFQSYDEERAIRHRLYEMQTVTPDVGQYQLD